MGAEAVGAASAGVLDAKLGKDYPIGAETDQTSTKCGKDDPAKHNWRGVTQLMTKMYSFTLMTGGEG